MRVMRAPRPQQRCSTSPSVNLAWPCAVTGRDEGSAPRHCMDLALAPPRPLPHTVSSHPARPGRGHPALHLRAPLAAAARLRRRQTGRRGWTAPAPCPAPAAQGRRGLLSCTACCTEAARCCEHAAGLHPTVAHCAVCSLIHPQPVHPCPHLRPIAALAALRHGRRHPLYALPRPQLRKLILRRARSTAQHGQLGR